MLEKDREERGELLGFLCQGETIEEKARDHWRNKDLVHR